MEKHLYYSTFNKSASGGIAEALKIFNEKRSLPVIICIGSDLVLGDSLGPITGTLLKKAGVEAFVYGTLENPITANEVKKVKEHIKRFHPDSFIIAVDAAVGDKDDVGLIKLTDKGLKPGLGVNKNLGTIGNAGIIGIVAEKSEKNYSLFNLTRLGLIYKMAETIAKGIADYVAVYNDNKYGSIETAIKSGTVKIKKVF